MHETTTVPTLKGTYCLDIIQYKYVKASKYHTLCTHVMVTHTKKQVAQIKTFP